MTTEPRANGRRLRLALPGKGRLAEPSVRLLHDAGLDFELSERRLTSQVSNHDLELLFVRTEDIAEYVADGVVDLGITGQDLVAERGLDVSPILELGFGTCALVLAVPRSSGVREVRELGGCSIATGFPRLTRVFLEERGVEAQLVEVHGAVEVTPQLGVADAVVDLVATGSTLRLNGLRPIATLLESQAVLIGGNGEDPLVAGLAEMLAAVVAARDREYMMLNAPASALEAIREIIPGLSEPTVMPLADPSMIAVHSVVERGRLWSLVPALKAAGARDILVVPIERVIQ
ncbi:MAG TPA: ATP phosphoribosyltransferase [candidate division Zixibacteria bacterium]|nr:ATP phosphoribosyltransferase [candidate division Zixibacteria bacterium]